VVNAAARPFRVPDSWPPQRRIEYLMRLVQDGLSDGEVCRSAKILSDSVTSEYRRERQIAEKILHFVQNMVKYTPDRGVEEWYQGAVYTLAHGGDCEDLSVLICALAKCAGLQSDVVWIDQPGARLNHVVARIFVDGVPLWADGSIKTAYLGEHPHDAVRRSQKYEDRLGMTRSSAMSFYVPTDTLASGSYGVAYESSGISYTGSGAPRPEGGYDPGSADYLREQHAKMLLGRKIMGLAFVAGVAVGAARGLIR
jgi:hypothetical protein